MTGNTTAAVGKGFAIGSAALVSLALYGAFVTRLGITGGECTETHNNLWTGLLVTSTF